jgi:hypothetical protein
MPFPSISAPLNLLSKRQRYQKAPNLAKTSRRLFSRFNIRVERYKSMSRS